MITQLYDALQQNAAQLATELIRIRQHLHQFPELSWNEDKTAAYLKENLKVYNINQFNSAAGVGFYVDIQGELPGPHIAYRADMDALPIQDEKTCAYASKCEGVAHMCGHDVHSTIALGVAALLQQHKEKLNGTVRVFWQPAEEVADSGAPKMIEAGVLKGIDAVFGIHVDPTTASGIIKLKAGADTAAVDSFRIEVKTAYSLHSARPHTGTDAVWVAHQLMSFLYQLPTRFTDSRDPLVISICVLKAGEAINVIPKEVQVSGTLRSTGASSRKRALELIRAHAASLSSLYECQIDVKLDLGAPAVMNDAAIAQWATPLLKDILGDEKVLPAQQSMGAEDFAYYTERVKALFLRVGTQNGPDTAHPLHSSLFDVDQTQLAPTCATLAYLLMKYNSQHRTT